MTTTDEGSPVRKGPIDTSELGFEGIEEPAYTISELFRLLESRGRDSFLVEDLIPIGSLISLSGDPKIGKSVLVNNLAVCVALGQSWLGKAVEQGPVLWYAFEESLEERAKILRLYDRAEEIPITTVLARTPVNREAGYQSLEERVKELCPKLVVIDPLVAAFGDVDFNDQSETRKALKRLKSLCNDYGTSVILIHHLRKDASAGPLDRNRTAGSAQIMATCSADWILKQDLTENGRTFRIRITGRLIGQKELVVQSTSMTDYAILREGTQAASTRVDENLARMKEIVREGAPKVFVRKELMEHHGFREGTVSRCMKKLGDEAGFEWEHRKGVWFDGKEEGDYNPFGNES